MKSALRTTIKMVTRDLLTDPPIYYEERYRSRGKGVWQCQLCIEEVPAAYDLLGHKIDYDDYMNFPHSGTCPVVLARHIEELLEGESE